MTRFAPLSLLFLLASLIHTVFADASSLRITNCLNSDLRISCSRTETDVETEELVARPDETLEVSSSTLEFHTITCQVKWEDRCMQQNFTAYDVSHEEVGCVQCEWKVQEDGIHLNTEDDDEDSSSPTLQWEKYLKVEE